MKTKVYIEFDAASIPGEAATILHPTGCGTDVAKVSTYEVMGPRKVIVRIDVDEGDERIAKVFALLAQYGVEAESFTYVEHSEEDLQQARLLLMSNSAVAELVSAGVEWGTQYDLTNACSHCEAGAKQTSVLYVYHGDMKLIRKYRVMPTTDGDILVDGGIRKKLVDAGVTGISFGDVRARHKNKKWSEVARDQILIAHALPPMRWEVPADEEQYVCKVCRRGGRMSTPSEPYREEDLVGMQDFNLSWEWFGEFRTRDHRFGPCRSKPNILVTPKVMNIFRDAGVKAFDWWPVNVQK